MKRSCLLLTTILLLGYYPAGLSAQQTGMEWLTTKQGLSQGYVSCLLQDKEGFIWAGTKNGLNRYDGYRFEVFTKDPYNEFSLSNDFINNLYEFSDFLVVCTDWGGINILHKKTRKVYRLHCAMPDLGTPLDQCNVAWAAVDARGNIWAEVQIPDQPWKFWRMYKFSVPPEFWQNPPTNNNWQKKITAQTWPQDVSTMPQMVTDEKFIIVPSPQGVFEINTASDTWTLVIPPLSPEKQDEGTCIRDDQHGKFLIVRRYLLNGRRASNLCYYQPDPMLKQAGQLQPIELDQPNLVLQHVSHDIVWLNFLGEISGYPIGKNGEFDLTRPEITGIKVPEGSCSSLTDRSGIVWFGTNGLGIVKVNLQSKRFQHLFPGESIYSPILQDRNGLILAYSNTSKPLYQPEQGSNALVKQFQTLTNGAMAQGEEGTCWFAGKNIGSSKDWVLKKINPVVGMRVFPIPYTDPEPLALTLDSQGDPWFGITGQLAHFNHKTEQFSVFDFRKWVPGPHNVFSLAQTGDGTWWLATRQGLVHAKPTGGAIENFDFEWLKNDPSSRNSLRNNLVASLLTDPNDPNILWIGTKGGGLDRLDVRSLQFTHLTTHDGLPDNVIYGVLAETSPSSVGTILWMSSNKGLIRYVPSTGVIKNYTEEDGVQANEFNTWAYGKGPTGELLFGGVNGMTVFHPRQLQEDTLAPRTLITRLRLNDQDVSWNDSTGVLTHGIEFTQEIVVPYSRNNIALEFVALHFASTSKNRFRYYLEGAEKDWSHESAEHSAVYLNLAPGTYVFRVKGSNSEGVWSTHPVELKITVLPPWYRTWLAWISYVLILGGSAYALYRYQLRTKLEHAENQRLKELDTFKSRFFTNITHEFRTPLTVILGMTDQLRESFRRNGSSGSKIAPSFAPSSAKTAAIADETAVSLIRRNGQNLLKLINQMLDLAKLEAGHLRLNLERGDVVPYLKYLTESFQSYADTKDIRLHFHTNVLALEMAYDKEKLQTVVTNLLSNAIKFTPPGGKVNLTVSSGPGAEKKTETIASGDALIIAVSDTGPGISAEKLPRIFDRFYQTDAKATRSNEGTGIGLALVRELVKMMNGEIRVESVLEKGTVFTVTLQPLLGRETSNSSALEGKNNTDTPLIPLYSQEDGSLLDFPVEPSNFEAPLALIVEDNPDVRYYLTACLQSDYRIALAENGQEGIEAAFNLTPDLVVSDVMMPEKDGFELCQTLKNDVRSSHIPIVLLTAKADVASRIEGLTRGADDYLAKPFDREELLVRLRNLIESRRRLQARYASMEPPTSTEDPDLQIEDAFLQNLRSFLESKLDDAQLSLETICRAMGMGRTNLNRKLTSLTGKSAVQYLRSLRMHRAKQLLSEGRMNISEVAFEVGYNDPKYFSRVFTEDFGVPPTQWKKEA